MDFSKRKAMDQEEAREYPLKKEQESLKEIDLVGKEGPLTEREENLKVKEAVHRSPEKEMEANLVQKASFLSLFKYADGFDIAAMILGCIGGVGNGFILPLALFICGGMINVFGENSNSGELRGHEFEKKVQPYVLYFVYLALGAWVVCFLEAACWMWTGERQSSRLRSKYLRAILRQNEGFFDVAGASAAQVVNSVSVDTLVIQDAMSEKVGQFIMNSTQFVGGFLVSVYLNWKLALVMLAFLPLLVLPGILYGRTLTGLAKELHNSYLNAGIVAEETLSSIRTVYSFTSEKKSLKMYSQALAAPLALGLKMGIAKGLAVGCLGITFAIWAFLSWYGSRLVINDGAKGGKIVAAGLALITGGLFVAAPKYYQSSEQRELRQQTGHRDFVGALGAALPNLKYFAEGQIAGHKIFTLIDRTPEIDSDDMSGKILDSVVGNMELRNIDFAYPARPKAIILNKMSLKIPSGATLALVGSSGCGKSTVIALLERFYDPSAGEVLIDGINIKELQLRWLRTQIGLVSQEPALFATTIRENILFGKEGATDEEIIKAAKFSNAHSFISGLPNLYETQVGERGVQMSGGQKQRIAIARAMLKNPPILLLDEATSALDAESEKLVQDALDNAAVGRTTVVVAHRLSTIRTADIIAVVQGGQIVEMGAHEELVRIGGAYKTLVQLQESKAEEPHEQENAVTRKSSTAMKRSSDFTWRNSLSNSQQPRRSQSAPYSGLFVDSDGKEERRKSPSFRRLLVMNKPEWKHGLAASAGAIGFGCVQPMYAFILGSCISAFYEKDRHKLQDKGRTYSLIFAALAVCSFIVNLVQHYNFAAMGENLTRRIRERMFAKLVTFEVGWFDEDENASGAVCSRLASEASVVRSLVADRISLVVQAVAAITVAFATGLIVAWQLALVMIAIQPLVVVCYYVKKVLLKSMYRLTLRSQDEAGQLASEAVSNHRTITAFSAQEKVQQMFDKMQIGPRRESIRRSYIAGCGLGTAQAVQFGTWALDFWWGGHLVSTGVISFSDLFKTFFILVASGRMIADAGSMTSDLARGANSVEAVFNIIDRRTKIDPDDPTATKVEKVDGLVELKDVEFAYPMRPDIIVFKNFSLKISPGKSVALVGQSGSGKSTIIGLIERFYDPVKGHVTIDGKDLRSLHLRTIRSHIALVGQEPTLFAGTIRENILYGKENATEAEVIEAAKAANAYNFICSLADGFDTSTGDRGVQLSGGQKQRVAIARAILRNPAILLLDEATSALDAQSEKIVQDALDRIMVGRTSIVVAHRLSTIQNCDSIAVLQDGCILEKGKHHELLAKGAGGAYYALVNLQRKSHQTSH